MLQSIPQAYLVGAGVWSITAELATICNVPHMQLVTGRCTEDITEKNQN